MGHMVWHQGLLIFAALGLFYSSCGSATTQPAVIEFSLSRRHSLVLRQDGSVWAAGDNEYGQLGDGSIANRKKFVKVVDGDVRSVATGSLCSFIVKNDGSLWATGYNFHGQLGFDSANNQSSFVSVTSSGVKSIASGYAHSMMLRQDGGVWVTGYNKYGQLGDFTENDKRSFGLVVIGGATAVAAGHSHSMILMGNGGVWTAGSNQDGQLGDGGEEVKRNYFDQVIFEDATAVAAGSFHSMVMKSDGSVWTVGANYFGQLGDGTKRNKNVFQEVISIGAKSMAAGYAHSAVLMEDGSVWTTGSNHFGQLGTSTTDKLSFFQAIAGGIDMIAAGDYNIMVKTVDDALWAAGWNQHAQLGDGTSENRRGFVDVVPVVTGTIQTPSTTTTMSLKCPTCGFNAKTAKFSCCWRGGTWFKKCGNPGDPKFLYTWWQGVVTCSDATTTSTSTTTSTTSTSTSTTTTSTTTTITVPTTTTMPSCSQCGVNKASGRLSCCFEGGSWFKQCGDVGDPGFAYTWYQGIQSCKLQTAPTTTTLVCPECGFNPTSGEFSCCFRGGSWHKKCGTAQDPNYEYTWLEGAETCKTATPPSTKAIPVCPKCGIHKHTGKPSCCHRGGTWYTKCGDPGDTNYDHTWAEGNLACESVTMPSTVKVVCPVCGAKKTGRISCCFRGGSWYNKCGDPGDPNFEYTWAEGNEICNTATRPTVTTPTCNKCALVPHTGKPSCCARGGSWFDNCGNPEEDKDYTWREGLIACDNVKDTTTTTTTSTEATETSGCPKCGSNNAGQRSCCFVGGSWHKKCGNPGGPNEHTWAEGNMACRSVPSSTSTAPTSTSTSSAVCPKCAINEQTGVLSCCSLGGSWHKQCGSVGDSNFDHTWAEGSRVCKNFVSLPVTTESTTTKRDLVCPNCALNKMSGKLSCCHRGGSWFNNCGDPGDSKFDYTWREGLVSCLTTTETPATIPTCAKCGTKPGGKPTCCGIGGSWFGLCGDPESANFPHSWRDGVLACKNAEAETTAANGTDDGLTTIPQCSKCGMKQGERSCCGIGGAWFGMCGDPDSSNLLFTWEEGLLACDDSVSLFAKKRDNVQISEQKRTEEEIIPFLSSGPDDVTQVNSEVRDTVANLGAIISLFVLIV